MRTVEEEVGGTRAAASGVGDGAGGHVSRVYAAECGGVHCIFGHLGGVLSVLRG